MPGAVLPIDVTPAFTGNTAPGKGPAQGGAASVHGSGSGSGSAHRAFFCLRARMVDAITGAPTRLTLRETGMLERSNAARSWTLASSASSFALTVATFMP